MPLVNVANGLTVVRLVLVPIFLVVLFTAGGHVSLWRWAAFGVFALASITDTFDGDLARRWDLVTDFGTIADPIADKALIGAALVGLSVLGELPWWITVTIAVREVGVTALRFWVLRHGVIPASRGGKIKTVLQTFALGFAIMPLPAVFAPGLAALILAAVAVTVVTGLDYLVRALRLRARAKTLSAAAPSRGARVSSAASGRGARGEALQQVAVDEGDRGALAHLVARVRPDQPGEHFEPELDRGPQRRAARGEQVELVADEDPVALPGRESGELPGQRGQVRGRTGQGGRQVLGVGAQGRHQQVVEAREGGGSPRSCRRRPPRRPRGG